MTPTPEEEIVSHPVYLAFRDAAAHQRDNVKGISDLTITLACSNRSKTYPAPDFFAAMTVLAITRKLISRTSEPVRASCVLGSCFIEAANFLDDLETIAEDLVAAKESPHDDSGDVAHS